MEITPLCHIQTPFKDKFGIPRQSGLIMEAEGILEFDLNNFNSEALRGIEDFSHLWLSFIFDKAIRDGEKSLVRPPRLGGKEKMGVWATRSPHRPNHLGLTVVKLLKVDISEEKIFLKVGGIDLLDGTPIVDIKPYVPYADIVPEAKSAWVPNPENILKPKVLWSEGIKELVSSEEAVLIEKVLEQDPRPSAQKEDKKSYIFKIFNYEVKFENGSEEFLILSIQKI